MIWRKIDPSNIDISQVVEEGVRLHGHYGPYLIAGVRMGIAALQALAHTGYKGIKAIVSSGVTPPRSCLLDGIQISTGCTIGKGNLAAFAPDGAVNAIFIAGEKMVKIYLKSEAEEMFESWSRQWTTEEAADKAMLLQDDDLFIVEEVMTI